VQPVLSTLTNLRLQAWILGVFVLGCCGCASFVDQVTDRQFKVKDLWAHPKDPLEILRDSHDGAERGKALARLKEPNTHGGTAEMQERYLKLLVDAATTNPPPKSLDPRHPFPESTNPDCLEPLVRLGAIHALGEYKDPRAAQALVEVYQGSPPSKLQGPLPFIPEMNHHIKLQALTALEKTGSATARELFISVLGTPGPGTKNAKEDSSQTNDERLAALRGLARFHDYEVASTLVRILETEKEIAIRDRAHESLKSITGKHFPQDAVAWRNYLQTTSKDSFAHEPSAFQRLFSFTAN
jgi:hypothetical protein